MAIKTIDGPNNGPRIVAQALSHLRPDVGLAMAAPGPSVQATRPLPVYFIGLDAIEGPQWPERTSMVGWRYLILGPGPVSSADLHEGPDAPDGAFARLNEGVHPNGLMAASILANDLYGSTASDFELRVLEIPSIYVAAVWLHGPVDHFFPYVEGRPGTPIDLAEDDAFVQRMAELAMRKRNSLANPQ